MILIGQFDSPFVRRVGVALELYGMPFEHRPWSTFGDAEQIAPFNPLMRVPTLVFDDGVVMADAHAIFAVLETMTPASKRLIPASPQDARKVWRICGFASGVSDKAVQLYYTKMFTEQAQDVYIARLRAQIENTLTLLDRERAGLSGTWWLGETMTHADIAVGAMFRHFSEAYSDQYDVARWPALQAHSAQCEALPVFQKISQPFVFTAPKQD